MFCGGLGGTSTDLRGVDEGGRVRVGIGARRSKLEHSSNSVVDLSFYLTVSLSDDSRLVGVYTQRMQTTTATAELDIRVCSHCKSCVTLIQTLGASYSGRMSSATTPLGEQCLVMVCLVAYSTPSGRLRICPDGRGCRDHGMTLRTFRSLPTCCAIPACALYNPES